MASGPFLYGQVKIDGGGRVAEDVPCVQCGRSLRGTRPDGTCPQCGHVVADAIRGDLLRFQSREWLGRLWVGSVVLTAGLVMLLIAGGIAHWVRNSPLVFPPDPQNPQPPWIHLGGFVWAVIEMVALLVPVAGVWLMTGSQPMNFEPEPTLSVRRVARYAAVAAGAIVTLLALGVALRTNWGSINRSLPGKVVVPLQTLATVAFSTAIVAMGLYAGTLARRGLRPRLAALLPVVGLIVAIGYFLDCMQLYLYRIMLYFNPIGGTLGDESTARGYVLMGWLNIALGVVAAIAGLVALTQLPRLTACIGEAARRYAALDAER